jgi:hypothetical protein
MSPLSNDRHLFVCSSAKLAAIRQRALDLCVWRRQVDAHWQAWLTKHFADSHVSFDERVDFAKPRIHRWLSSLPATPERARLQLDIEKLLTRFSVLARRERGRAQLHVVRTQHCPKFHVDMVRYRMITTYFGAGTEWIAESDVKRQRLASSSVESAPLRRGARWQRLQSFDVAVMKGASETNREFGVVHRSPHVHDDARLVLTIDAKE